MVVTRRPQSSTQATADETASPATLINGSIGEAVDETYLHTNGAKSGKPTVSSNKEQPMTEVVRAATPSWAYATLALFIAITVVSFPIPFQPEGEATLKHVFYYTAIRTKNKFFRREK